MQHLEPYLINALTALIIAGLGYATKYIVNYLKHKGIVAQIESHKQIVSIVVNAVEQIYTDLHGQDKFNKAKEEIVAILERKKINIDEKQIDMLIESAVAEIKKDVKTSV